MEKSFTPDERRQLAERVRQACIEAALAGYENASISGLCHEGAWECAISAMRVVDLRFIAEASVREDGS